MFLLLSSDLPKESPRIRLKSSEETFRVGAFLNASCTSGLSRPPARLQFLINNQPADSKLATLKELLFEYAGPGEPLPPLPLQHLPATSGSSDSTVTEESEEPLYTYELTDRHRPSDDHFWKASLYRTHLQMLFYLDPGDFAAASWSETFQPPAINIKCVSFVSHVLTQKAERILSPLPAEPPSTTVSSVTANENATHDEQDSIKFNQTAGSVNADHLPRTGGPFILGGQRRYSPNQLVNVTCASRKSRFGADLRWYVNDREAPQNLLQNYRRIEFDDGIVTLLDLIFNVSTLVNDSISSSFTNLNSKNPNSTLMQQAVSSSSTPSSLPPPPLKLRCTATLSRVINMRSRELFLGNTRRGGSSTVEQMNGNYTTSSSETEVHFRQTWANFMLISCFQVGAFHFSKFSTSL